MAKHKKEEIKKIVVKVETERTVNAHLKEKIDVEGIQVNGKEKIQSYSLLCGMN